MAKYVDILSGELIELDPGDVEDQARARESGLIPQEEFEAMSDEEFERRYDAACRAEFGNERLFDVGHMNDVRFGAPDD